MLKAGFRSERSAPRPEGQRGEAGVGDDRAAVRAKAGPRHENGNWLGLGWRAEPEPAALAWLDEQDLIEALRLGDNEAAIRMLSLLTQAPPLVVESVIYAARPDLALILCRAGGLSWLAVEECLRLRETLVSGRRLEGGREREPRENRRLYDALTLETARALRAFLVRRLGSDALGRE